MPRQPDRLQPTITHQDLMHPTPGKLFAGRGWIFELKYDGFRCLASSRRGAGVRLESRNGRDMTACFPEIAEELAAIDADLVLDGELVICDEMGRPQWQRLRKRHMLRNERRIAAAAAADPACIFSFDLLWLNDEDYRHLPLVVRKAQLGAVLRGSARVKYADHFEGSPAPLWHLAQRLQLEGIVAKAAASVYRAGRTNSWMKIKTAIGEDRERQRRP
jgi:ATP-dependent DNA ligase